MGTGPSGGLAGRRLAAELAAPVAISALFGVPAGLLYDAARPDILPHALAAIAATVTGAVAISVESRRLARAARALIAAVAAWMLADIARHFGAPPYVVLPAAVLLYWHVAVSASIIGGVFGRAMGSAFIFSAALASLIDLVLVYKAKLYFASASLRKGVEELAVGFGTYVLGLADLLWYSAAFAVAAPAKVPLVAAAIYSGLLVTARLAEGRGYAPALPLPMLLSCLVLLLPIP